VGLNHIPVESISGIAQLEAWQRDLGDMFPIVLDSRKRKARAIERFMHH
jgi:hypothetical protein